MTDRATQVMQTADSHLMDTYGRFPIVIERGSGATLHALDGKAYIDFASGVGVSAIGHGQVQWVEAVQKQAGLLAHCSNYYYNEPNAICAEKLMQLSGMARVFFGNSGAEANEGAIKLARKYSADRYGAGRSTIITLNNSFHGRTVTTLDATGQPDLHNPSFSPFTGGFRYADATLSSIEARADDSVCAIMMEGIRGEGGVLPLDADFAKEVAAFAKARDILLIFDEVQTGIGRTGKLFCYEHFGITPDIVTTAKGLGGGLPIGVFFCTEALAGVLGRGQHGSTFGGNPIACAGASVVLDIVGKSAFLQQVCEKGAFIKEKILEMNSPHIKAVRGFGLMIGCEMQDGLSPRALCDRAAELGLLVITAGKNVVRMLPPLTISYDEITKGLERFEALLKEV